MRLELLSVILMSGRPDRMIFNVCGFVLGGGGGTWYGREHQGCGVTGLVSQRG